MLTRDIEPRLGKKTLDELTEEECWDAVYSKAKGSKVRANEMAGELNRLLRWCSAGKARCARIVQ
jgi:hypothetical protein